MTAANFTMPDFEAWANSITEDSNKTVSEALYQAFEQGRALGFRQGQEDEASAWWRMQDQELMRKQ